MRAQLTVTPVKDDELIAHLTKPETAKVHTTLTKGAEYVVPQNLQYTPLPLSQEPFVIKLNEGIVSKI